MIDFERMAELFDRADSFLFFLHVQPDGDSIGSTLALSLALRKFGKRTVVVEVDPVPRLYRFLPGTDQFVPWDKVEGEFDLAVFLDCGDLDRIGQAKALLPKAGAKVNIDHHTTNTLYGDHNFIDYRAAAAGEIVHRLIHEMGIPIDRHIATCLYTSIVTDTGYFRYENTTLDTHMAVSELYLYDIDTALVAEALHENEPLHRLKLLGRALDTLTVDESGKIAWIEVPRFMLDLAGASDEDTEGLVNYARSVQGVQVGLIFRETADGGIRVGFRSRRGVDVSSIAGEFGGGGHARASGCTVDGPLDVARERVLQVVRKAVAETVDPWK